MIEVTLAESDVVDVGMVNESSVGVDIDTADDVGVDILSTIINTGGGENGGYYTPSVISNYLHWTASKSSMPFVQPSYIGIKHNTKTYWDSQLTYVPTKGEIVIYEDYKTVGDVIYAGIKVGDGNAYLVDLPFVGEEIMTVLSDHINNSAIHVSAVDRVGWNSKMSCYCDDTAEKLVFVTT